MFMLLDMMTEMTYLRLITISGLKNMRKVVFKHPLVAEIIPGSRMIKPSICSEAMHNGVS
jgi:hypothetical protein